jgi:hypothetical protein
MSFLFFFFHPSEESVSPIDPFEIGKVSLPLASSMKSDLF